MSTIKLNIIKAIQPLGELIISTISPDILLEMSRVDRRRIEQGTEISGIQRELKQNKVNQIKNYLKSIDATFPNTIILNTQDEFVVSETEYQIELEVNPNTFTIIDGQHRLEGFRENLVPNFELIITIFRNLDLSQQANIFSTINSQQTKVDPSLNLNLELNEKVFTPKKMIIELAQSFNYDRESPWHNNIKLLGSGSDGFISLAAFVAPLLDLTYPESEYFQIRNVLLKNKEVGELNEFGFDKRKFFFWNFYLKNESSTVYKILFNYFCSIKNLLPNDWLNETSILNKTTGYNAIIKLFKDYLLIGIDKGDLSYDFFFNALRPINKLEGKINTDNFGASGQQASNQLYLQFKTLINNNEN